MATILCTETNSLHVYSSETYDTMCMYEAIDGKSRTEYETIATDEDAEWWHEYERVNEECEEVAEERGIDICHDAEFVLGVGWDDLGDAMDRIAEYLGVRGMFAPEAQWIETEHESGKPRNKKDGMTPSSVADKAREAASVTEGAAMELQGKHL